MLHTPCLTNYVYHFGHDTFFPSFYSLVPELLLGKRTVNGVQEVLDPHECLSEKLPLEERVPRCQR